MAQIDERTKVRVSQTLKKNLQKQQAWGGASTVRRRGEVSGTASSVAFTPLQVSYTVQLAMISFYPKCSDNIDFDLVTFHCINASSNNIFNIIDILIF